MVFKTKAEARPSYWAHIMCDPEYKSWQSMELFPAEENSEKRFVRLKAAQPTKGEDCTWPSSFLPHIDVGPDMEKSPLLTRS